MNKVSEILKRYQDGKRNFRFVDLRNKILHHVNLSGADLSRAELTGANLTRTLYNSQTKFPLHFSPNARGAILSQDLV